MVHLEFRFRPSTEEETFNPSNTRDFFMGAAGPGSAVPARATPDSAYAPASSADPSSACGGRQSRLPYP